MRGRLLVCVALVLLTMGLVASVAGARTPDNYAPGAAGARGVEPYTVTGLEWWYVPSNGFYTIKRYKRINLDWGVFLHTDPIYTHDGEQDYYLNVPTTVTIERHHTKSPKWRRVTSWGRATKAALPPTSAAKNHSSFSAKWRLGIYRYRMVIKEPTSGLRLTYRQSFKIVRP